MKDLPQYLFIKDLSQYMQQFNTLKGFETCDCIFWLANNLLYYGFSKNGNG